MTQRLNVDLISYGLGFSGMEGYRNAIMALAAAVNALGEGFDRQQTEIGELQARVNELEYLVSKELMARLMGRASAKPIVDSSRSGGAEMMQMMNDE